MNLELVFWIIIALVFSGWVLCVYSFFKNLQRPHDLGERVLFVGLIIQLLYVVVTFVEHLPFESLSGVFLFGSLLVMALYFVLDFYVPKDIFEVLFPPLTLFFLLLSKVAEPHPFGTEAFLGGTPVFGKAILFTHASMTMLGYLLFGVACATSIFFLYQEKRIKKKLFHLNEERLPSLGYLDHFNHRVVAAGFMLITGGLLMGILMRVLTHEGVANVGLRQILPLVTWVTYAGFLLDRSIQGVIGRISAIWSILGFGVVVVSFAYEISILMGAQS